MAKHKGGKPPPTPITIPETPKHNCEITIKVPPKLKGKRRNQAEYARLEYDHYDGETHVKTRHVVAEGPTSFSWTSGDGGWLVAFKGPTPLTKSNLGGKPSTPDGAETIDGPENGDYPYTVAVFPPGGGAPIIDDPSIIIDWSSSSSSSSSSP